MKIKTSKLTGPALDWAVACCEYPDDADLRDTLESWATMEDYSTDWSQGGPIIERERIELGIGNADGAWAAGIYEVAHTVALGATPLIAAMRSYVRSKLGDEVNVPEELCA